MVQIKKKLHYLDVNNYIHHSPDVILSMVYNCKELADNERLEQTLLFNILNKKELKELNDNLCDEIILIDNNVYDETFEAFN